ncbi:CatB-related O-acetyltransferase [Flavobacterium psychrotolerans]|nr:CatB-related O-acetyltransferase [Flavobacterium psychrotolerans]
MHSSIGRFCSIASNVSVVIGQHPTKKYVSTHPAFFSMLKQSGFTFAKKNTFKEFLTVDENEEYAIKIGNDVWIGFGVMIMEGVTIGDGAIVGTGALVTKDIEPYSINIGIPAKKIGYRFDAEEIQYLLKYQWWNKDFDFLRKNVHLFTDISEFISQS